MQKFQKSIEFSCSSAGKLLQITLLEPELVGIHFHVKVAFYLFGLHPSFRINGRKNDMPRALILSPLIFQKFLWILIWWWTLDAKIGFWNGNIHLTGQENTNMISKTSSLGIFVNKKSRKRVFPQVGKWNWPNHSLDARFFTSLVRSQNCFKKVFSFINNHNKTCRKHWKKQNLAKLKGHMFGSPPNAKESEIPH